MAKANSDLVAAFAKATSKEVERNSNSNTGATLGASVDLVADRAVGMALSHFTENQRKMSLFYEAISQDLSVTLCNYLANAVKTELRSNMLVRLLPRN